MHKKALKTVFHFFTSIIQQIRHWDSILSRFRVILGHNLDHPDEFSRGTNSQLAPKSTALRAPLH